MRLVELGIISTQILDLRTPELRLLGGATWKVKDSSIIGEYIGVTHNTKERNGIGLFRRPVTVERNREYLLKDEPGIDCVIDSFAEKQSTVMYHATNCD